MFLYHPDKQGGIFFVFKEIILKGDLIMKKAILTFIILILASSNVYGAQVGEIYARGAVLMDMNTKRVLWERSSDLELAVASTTKIMTALIALENGNLEETATVSQRAASAPKVHLGLKKGEQYRLKDLLFPLMLESSNDAAVVIAEYVGGSVENFADIMNKRAEEIGANNTFFVTPNGLDQNGNHSTAYDMALITCEALENEEFLKLIGTLSYTLSSTDGKRTFTVNNKNRLLREFEGALGVKTGFTGMAGHCFVGAAEKDGATLISVVLGSGWGTSKEKKWIDTKKLLNYGFNNYSLEKVLEKGTYCGKTIVLNSDEKEVNAVVKDEGYAMISQEEKSEIKVKARINKSMEAPVKKGDVIGKVWVETSSGEELFKTDLVAERDINKKTMKSSMEKVINNWLNSSFRDIIFPVKSIQP